MLLPARQGDFVHEHSHEPTGESKRVRARGLSIRGPATVQRSLQQQQEESARDLRQEEDTMLKAAGAVVAPVFAMLAYWLVTQND